MKIENISRDQLTKEVARDRRKNRYYEVYEGLDKLGLGQALKISFATVKEANNCRSSVMKTLKDKGSRNGVVYRSRQQGSALYFYPKARVLK
jgi:hypothetical protein